MFGFGWFAQMICRIEARLVLSGGDSAHTKTWHSRNKSASGGEKWRAAMQPESSAIRGVGASGSGTGGKLCNCACEAQTTVMG
ncbi:hypothetical protein J1614_004564 [Plenodomus biglobosus]|nr:hypothetical protein J1614_004564 [Plenodomus biglobosus]